MRFDAQASSFDRRAGLPAAAVERIAAAIIGLRPAGTWLLEVGAGTAEIGARLARHGRYLGLDVSLSMLAEAPRPRSALLQADADRPWPVPDGSVGLMFLSRAAHLLEREHLVAEACRLAHPAGSRLVLGRVERHRESVRAVMRRRVHQLLAERGLPRRQGRAAGQEILEAIAARGGAIEPVTIAATWPRAERPADALAGWRGKEGLAGNRLEPAVHAAVLAELEAWARAQFGDLDSVHQTTESYELAAVRLPLAARSLSFRPQPHHEEPA